MDTRGRHCYDLADMNIVLFGAGGRLGTAFLRVLPHHTFVTPSRTDVDLADVAALTAYLQKQKADVVVNCIAYNNLEGAEADPAIADLVNATYASNLAEASAKANLPIVHFSTDYEFDGEKTEGYVERDEPNPLSAYGRSKKLGSDLVAVKNPKHYVIRVSCLYGAPGSSPNAKRSFVEVILEQAKKDPEFEVNDSGLASPTLVDDIARHVDTYVLSALSTLTPGTYHMANSGGATRYGWAKAVVELRGLPNVVQPKTPAPWSGVGPRRPVATILLSTKLPPMRPWREALADYLK